jgi:hypothetical protein
MATSLEFSCSNSYSSLSSLSRPDCTTMLSFKFDEIMGSKREVAVRLGAAMLVALVSRDIIVVLLPVKLEVEFAALEETLEEDVIGGGGINVTVVALPWVRVRLLIVLPVPNPNSVLDDLCDNKAA